MSDGNDIPAADCEQFWERLQARTRNERSAADVAGIAEAEGQWVLIKGLQSSSGKGLNGKVGQLLTKEANDDGRYVVRVDGVKGRKLLKPSNFAAVQKHELARTYLLPDHKIVFYPKIHSMFTECDPNGNSPALALCGCPLIVKKLNDGSSGDNQWATWMMIDPVSGFAPPQWQCNVGRTLVYRPGGLDLGRDDMAAINEFLGSLLDHYGDGGFDPRSWLNPDWFRRYIRSTQSMPSVGIERKFNVLG